MPLRDDFRPRMQSQATGFRVVDDLVWRGWGGIVADFWRVRCEPEAHGSYVSPDPRLFVILDITPGGVFELTSDDGASAVHNRPWSMAYIPANVALRGRTRAVEQLSHLDIHLPEVALTRRFGRSLDHTLLGTMRLQFEDERIAAIAKLLVDECRNIERLDDRYGVGLIEALATALFSIKAERPKGRPSLSRQQLDRTRDYIDANCFETIRLSELASLLGLSETYFSHAFKASTGMPPLRWQMETRIAKVKDMLADTRLTLTEIAASAGFSDQAHLTRSFKRSVGVAPSEWRRLHLPKTGNVIVSSPGLMRKQAKTEQNQPKSCKHVVKT
jgi:AraC family transcriptional regulator